MYFIVYFFILLLVLVYAYVVRYYRQIILATKLPGPKAYPIIGNYNIVRTNAAINEMAGSTERYGALGRFWLSFIPFFVVLRPDDIQTILSSKVHIDKSPFYNIMHSYMGDSIVLANGESWHNKRKLLNPFFHISVMEKLFGIMSEGGQQLCNLLATKDEGINITSYLNNCVDQILNCAILGVPLRGDSSREVDLFRKRRNMMYTRINSPWLAIDWVFNMTGAAATERKQKKEFYELIRTNVALRREAMAQGEVETDYLLDLLIKIADTNDSFTLDDIVTEAFTLLITASDTTSASLVYAIYLLAKHPEILEKCLEEQLSIFSSADDPMTMNELRRMKYLEQCISESLRLYPVLPLIGRRLKHDVEIGGEFNVPSESEILIPVYELHRNREIYPDPEKFDPNRFSPENCATRHAYSYIPFSAGPRNCIGQKFAMLQMKIVLSHVIRTFKLELVPGKETLTPRYRILLYAHGGVWIKFNKREDQDQTAATVSTSQ